MKVNTLFITFLLMTGYMFGQTTTYPLVTLHDINFIPDTTTGWPNTSKAGDTVRVQGVVMVKPIVNFTGDRRVILNQPPGWTCNIQTEDRSPWGGLNIYQNDTNVTATKFDLCDTNRTYEFTGVVRPNGQSTELDLITSPTPIPVNLISHIEKRPDPIILTLDSCFNGDGSFNVKLRKYLGMYVKFVPGSAHPNIITSDIITGQSINAGGFKIDDGNGHFVQVFAKSNYIKTGTTYTLRPSYFPPANGTYLSQISGLLYASNNVWEIIPMYPEDLSQTGPLPPFIFNCKRNPGVVTPNTPVIVSATVHCLSSGIIQTVKLFKTVNGVLDSLNMTKGTGTDSTTYTCTIPGIASDSAFVDYYIKATDNTPLSSTSPGKISNSRYSFFVLKPSTPFTIQHVRYSPFGNAYSGYNGYQVTVSGVVTADTSDIPGSGANNPPRVFIQNGTTPWSGIILGYQGTHGLDVYNLRQGDLVTVTGIPVFSSASGTRLDTISALTIISYYNPIPETHIMSTGTVGNSAIGTIAAEQWNGCVVKYQNVTIDGANADGDYNYGESFCQDTSLGNHTRITWSDGRTGFFVGPNAVAVHNGDKFYSITGVLGYTHYNYKLCPRNNSDIGLPEEVHSENYNFPSEFRLDQNYPNPFNPSTIIRYSIKTNSLVTLKVYNILGKEVAIILNENKQPGEYEVDFSTGKFNLASGVYFYRLTAGSFTSIKKMLLLK
jgi:hypothetical protein